MPMERPGGPGAGNPRKLSAPWRASVSGRRGRPLLSKPLLVYAGIRAFGSRKERSQGEEALPCQKLWASVGMDFFVQRVNKGFHVKGSQLSKHISTNRISYVSCRAYCKTKMWGPLFEND